MIKRIKNAFLKINTQDLVKNSSQVGYAFALIGILNIFFQYIVSRNLGPAAYGEFETLLTINSVIIFTLSSVGFIVTKFISAYKTKNESDKIAYMANWSFVFFFLIGLGFFITTVIFSKIIAHFLNIADYSIIIVFGLLIWISFLVPIIEGILRGLQDFKNMGRYKILEAVLRTILASIILYFGLKTKGLFVGLIFGSLFAIIIAMFLMRKTYSTKATKIDLKEVYKFTMPAFFACILLGALTTIDLILIKHTNPAETAGNYAAASILAKISFGVAFGVAGVMFPKVIEDNYAGKKFDARSILRNSLKISILIGLPISILLAIFPSEVGLLLFGEKYTITSMLGIYSFAILFLGIVSVFMMYDLALKKYKFIGVFLIGAILQVYFIKQNFFDVYKVVWILFFINLGILLFMILYNWNEVFKKSDEHIIKI